jgi:hypothetical protein
MELEMNWVKRLSVVAFAMSFAGGAAAIEMQLIAVDESIFDTENTEIALVSAEEGDVGSFTLQTARTDTGHLQHSRSNDGRVVFEVQDRVNFENWLSETWLATSGEGRLDEKQVHDKRFNLGLGIYATVPHLSGVCTAYLINTGRKARAVLTRNATEELFGGTHCSAETGEAVVASLIDEIDAVRLRR